MILVGIGCSFTQGAGLAADPLQSYEYNTPYREKNCWVGQLADKLGQGYINLGDGGAGNFAIGQNFARFINYDLHMCDEPIMVCVGWTQVDRMSWWDEEAHCWAHSGWWNEQGIIPWKGLAGRANKFENSRKEWLLHSQGGEGDGNQALTDSAKLLVNSVCESKNIPLLQFNALGDHHTYHDYKNYYLPDTNVQDYLKPDQIIPNDLHPNELGHSDIASRLYNFINECKIL